MSQPAPRRATVLVYSSSETTRQRILTALGTRPAPGLELEFVEASTGREVVSICDGGSIDLAILDGEAAPTGGIGLGRQLKAELDAPPPVLLVVGRRIRPARLGPHIGPVTHAVLHHARCPVAIVPHE